MLLLLIKRFFGRTEAGDGEKASPESVVERIAQGEPGLRDTFIAAYRPYIAKVTSRFCKRYIDPTCDDEFSIALLAFNEAIDQFSPTAGKSFIGFAETVIRRRLIDYVRKEQRHAHTVPMSAFDTEDDEDTPVNPVVTGAALAIYDKERQSERRRYEIEAFMARLQPYGISFLELAEKSPKHADSRAMLYGIGARLASDAKLFALLETKRQLPIKELTLLCEVSRKTLERNRKFIIAAALILQGDYPHLQAYLERADGTSHRTAEGVGL
ncbi:RNA polymerase sigma factor SigI [Paenibacillus darwinianus]|uniref:RNA polymerase sigma factor SigI n=1 Tax=Paenibacillus darwinianus TaxID=1380763 RepID=A0A9W5W817_9BACL|nr:RNA polymerase sigma factor SigI [Paenibacillus darwinianus]EXX87726.1 RNA polymerase sigma factor SigI [Paenibacillus darwinianus]EXX91426.1 RNA polymerase sigma factor SigI [Paenibacillus darwinianus]EXX92193.1 RNA polymerase sigma factor SigI [Paenibacillus darwinianus]